MNHSPQDHQRLSPADHEDMICDPFDRAWRAGEQPQLEEYLDRVDATQQASLLRDLLEVEIEYRGAKADLLSCSEYELRFPQHVSLVRDIFSHRVENVGTRAYESSQRTLVETDSTEPGGLPEISDYEILEVLGQG